MNTSWSSADWIKALASLFVIGGGGLYFALICLRVNPPPKLDRFGCPVGQQVSACTLVLADITDAWSPSQVKAFHRTVEGFISKSPAWGMVAIGTIRDLPPRMIGEAVSPPHVSPMSDMWSHPYESWVQINAHYQAAFYRPLETVESQMPFNTTAPFSPIFQTMEQAIGRLGNYWREAKTRRLVIFSDMMENTVSFSQYSHAEQFDSVSAKQRFPYLSDALDLQGTEVTVYYLTGLAEDRPFQGERHELFWRELLTANGAQVRFIEVPFHPAVNPQNTITYVQSN